MAPTWRRYNCGRHARFDSEKVHRGCTAVALTLAEALLEWDQLGKAPAMAQNGTNMVHQPEEVVHLLRA
jgi:hypothetical protein